MTLSFAHENTPFESVVIFPPLAKDEQFKEETTSPPDVIFTPPLVRIPPIKVLVAEPETYSVVVVALVEVPFETVRFVIVEVELLEKICPRVERPVTVSDPLTVSLFDTTSTEVVAFVEVEFIAVRFAIVEDAELEKIPL